MARRIDKKPIIKNITQYKSVLIGLLGHVDSGKTAIARLISQIISTAGLDAHPQSKERGITIDLGFTSLIMDDTLITLVDAPGHADLIRSVVASANIIEGAILVIDGKEGIQIQTFEHLVILESFGIKNLLIVINKMDIISEEHANKLENEIKKQLSNSIFRSNFLIVKISAKENTGTEILKDNLLSLVQSIKKSRNQSTPELIGRNKEELLVFPIDHNFKIKGKGTIVTGTTLSGSIKTGDNITLLPHNKKLKVKSLQIYHQEVEFAPMGFRVGVGLSGVEKVQLERGNFLTNRIDDYSLCEIAEITPNLNNYFKKNIPYGIQINVTIGMRTTNARLFPFKKKEDVNMIIRELKSEFNLTKKGEIGAYLWFNQPEYLKKREKILLSRLDISPKTLRIFGTAIIQKLLPIKTIPDISYIKQKIGHVKNAQYGTNTALVEGLAQTKQGADTLINRTLENPFEKIISSFGNKGVVVVKIRNIAKNENSTSNLIENGDEVKLNTIRKITIH